MADLMVQITSRGVVLAEADRRRFRDGARRLAKFGERLEAVRIAISVPNRRLHGDPIRFVVSIRLAVPGNDLVVRRQTATTLTTARQRAFEAARRQLQDHFRKFEPPAPIGGARAIGRVTRLFPWEGYGFLRTADGRQVYFHRNSVAGLGFGGLEIGARVGFVEEEGESGPQATFVEAVRRRRLPAAR